MVACVATLALSSACSGDTPQPNQLADGDGGGKVEQSKQDETPTPTPTEPELDDHQQELYDDTVTFYDTISKAYETLDTSPIEDLLTPGSEAASGYTDYIDDVKAKGNEFAKAPEYEVSDFDLEADADSTTEQATFTLTASALEEVDAKGETKNSFDEMSEDVSITFEHMGERWIVNTQDVED